MDMYAPEKDKFKKEKEEQNPHQNSQQQKTEQKNTQTLQNKKDEMILDYIKERERNTARRALNKEDYSEPQSNQKDW